MASQEPTPWAEQMDVWAFVVPAGEPDWRAVDRLLRSKTADEIVDAYWRSTEGRPPNPDDPKEAKLLARKKGPMGISLREMRGVAFGGLWWMKALYEGREGFGAISLPDGSRVVMTGDMDWEALGNRELGLFELEMAARLGAMELLGWREARQVRPDRGQLGALLE